MKKLILLIVVLFSIATTNAQNETARWAFGGGISAIDFSGPQTKQYFQFKQFRGNQRYFVGRYLNPSFNLKADLTFGKVWFPKVTAYPEVILGRFENRHIYDFGVNLEYKLNNGYILKETAIVAPYLFTGFGTNWIVDYGAKNNDGTDINTYIPFGVGLNIRITNWMAINLSSAYKLNLDNSFDYTQHVASLVLNFGGKPKGGVAKDIETEVIDSDGDGVVDLIDECPFAAGAENMHGCPDTDGDGLGDSRDDCPKVAGSLINKGCPAKDSDGDGIPDDKDSCPNTKGEKRYAGCPDTDGDGIVDKYDQCPNKKGVASNNGCPADDHSMHDHSKHTNNTTTTHTTNVNTTQTTVTNNVSSTPINTTSVNTTSTNTNTGTFVEKVVVYFGSASDAIPSTEFSKLQKVLTVLKANPSYKALLKGYTDSQGDDAANVNLSLKRATTVWQYLYNNGMAGEQADLFGYGEYHQDANTNQGNRRVVIEIVK